MKTTIYNINTQNMKNQLKLDVIKILIIFSFILSLIVSKYYLSHHDTFNLRNDGTVIGHKMIKYDVFRYLSHGAEIKKDLKNGKSFFETGRVHFTKYLPPRIAAAYYYFFDKELFNNFEDKKINLGIHFPYLVIQCLFYYLSLLFLYSVISKKIKKKICLPIIMFLAIEPTLFQYHGTFWSESIFFSLQIILLALILKDRASFYNLLLVGLFLSLLSLQKQVAYFFIIPLFLYYFIFLKKNEYYKLLYLLFSFFLIQSFVGYNNLVREGKFYILTGDTKSAVYHTIVPSIVLASKKISLEAFRLDESKIIVKWLHDNSIKFDLTKGKKNTSDPLHFKRYKDALVNKSDIVRYNNFIAERTLNLLLENKWTTFKYVVRRALGIIVLNPFHIYSDHNFQSGEVYYETDTHDNLIPIRVIYSILIYVICLAGFVYLMKQKEYKLLSILVLSILYNYGMVCWNGNTRYFVPVLIYVSFFFGFGVHKIILIMKDRDIRFKNKIR